MKKVSILFFLLLLSWNCQAQEKRQPDLPVGGPCEGCEAIHEYGDQVLEPVDTLPDFFDQGPRLKVTGTIYQRDGKSPAAGVILYVYHTDQTGIYPAEKGATGWARRHGYIRGWIKTGADGRYTFYTLRPATYPSRTEPAHIHATIKEPGKQEYYIDSYHFTDDPLLTKKVRAGLPNRGGSGIVTASPEGNLLAVRRDIILGQNIPGYP